MQQVQQLMSPLVLMQDAPMTDVSTAFNSNKRNPTLGARHRTPSGTIGLFGGTLCHRQQPSRERTLTSRTRTGVQGPRTFAGDSQEALEEVQVYIIQDKSLRCAARFAHAPMDWERD